MNNGFLDWWGKINCLIKKGLAILFIVLIATQILLMNQVLKTFVSRTDKLEGKSIEDSQLYILKGEIELTIENEASLSPMIIYINGDSIKTTNNKSIRLQVKDSDIIEVSGAEFIDAAILRVTSVSDNIIVPELGKLIYVNNNLVQVDRVRLK